MNADENQPRSYGTGRTVKRGRIWHIEYSVRGKRYRVSSKSENIAVARKMLKTKLGDAQSGKPVGPQIEKTCFADLAKILLDDLKANGRRIKKRHAPLEHARTFFGDHELAVDITTDRLTAFVAHRQEEGAANATVNRSLAAIRRAFNLAKRAGRVYDVPYFPMLREDNARQGFLEQAQFLALREHLPEDLRGIVTFLWLTGWRVGEALTLGWDSVYADAIRLKATHSKNRHGRELPLVGELKEVIAQARANRKLNCPTVFSRGGKPIKSFVAAWRAACKDAGLGERTFRVHDIRRSAARNLIRAGVPENIAMHFTGHKTSSVFRRYDIVTAEDLAAASSRLETHLNAQSAKPKVVPLRKAE